MGLEESPEGPSSLPFSEFSTPGEGLCWAWGRCGQGHRAHLHVSSTHQLTRAQCPAKEGPLRPHGCWSPCREANADAGMAFRRQSAGQAQAEKCILPLLIPSFKGFGKVCLDQIYKDCRALYLGNSVSALLVALLVTGLILEQRKCYKIFLSISNHWGINGRRGTRTGISETQARTHATRPEGLAPSPWAFMKMFHLCG